MINKKIETFRLHFFLYSSCYSRLQETKYGTLMLVEEGINIYLQGINKQKIIGHIIYFIIFTIIDSQF